MIDRFARDRRSPDSDSDSGASMWIAHVGRLHRITSDPQVCEGRPCLRGMRIRVKDLRELLASGAEAKEILADFPYLASEKVLAAPQHAANAADHAVLRVA